MSKTEKIYFHFILHSKIILLSFYNAFNIESFDKQKKQAFDWCMKFEGSFDQRMETVYRSSHKLCFKP